MCNLVVCGAVMAIHGHKFDNLDICTERISIYHGTKERVMPDGSGRWNQHVAVECIGHRKTYEIETKRGRTIST